MPGHKPVIRSSPGAHPSSTRPKSFVKRIDGLVRYPSLSVAPAAARPSNGRGSARLRRVEFSRAARGAPARRREAGLAVEALRLPGRAPLPCRSARPTTSSAWRAVRASSTGSRRRHRPGLGDASGGRPRHRQVDAAAAGGGAHRVRPRRALRERRGVGGPGWPASPAPRHCGAAALEVAGRDRPAGRYSLRLRRGRRHCWS